MMKTRYYIVLCVFMAIQALLVRPAQAQIAIIADEVSGRPIHSAMHTNVQGEPLLFKDWQKATVHFDNGEKLKNLDVRYDLIDDVLFFKAANGQVYYFKHKVTEFWLHTEGKDMHFKAGLPAVDGQSASNYYEVLVEGPVSLLKMRKKTIQESQVYGSSTAQRLIHDVENLYIYVNGSMHKVKRSEKSVLSALQPERAALKKLIDQHKFDLRKEADLIDLLREYNVGKSGN